MDDIQSHITLKWGTLKSWKIKEEDLPLLERYNELGSCLSAMGQRDTPEQKDIICKLIDKCDDPEGIYLDWDCEYVSKEKAKKYVMEYGHGRTL